MGPRGSLHDMEHPNVLAADPAWDAEQPDPPARSKVARVGARAGSRRLGASLYELAPGGAVSPYHLHHANEELLVVIAGTPELRTPDGTETLAPGDVVAFPAGPGGAHGVRNRGTGPARVLVISTMRFPEVAEHVATGSLLALTGPAEGRIYASAAEGSFADLWRAALAAEDAGA